MVIHVSKVLHDHPITNSRYDKIPITNSRYDKIINF